MLVLSRKINESIVINDDIVITVLACEGDRVKIGISAPKDVSIYREELWEAMREQDQIAEKLAVGSEPDAFQVLRQMLAEEISEVISEEDEDKAGESLSDPL